MFILLQTHVSIYRVEVIKMSKLDSQVEAEKGLYANRIFSVVHNTYAALVNWMVNVASVNEWQIHS